MRVCLIASEGTTIRAFFLGQLEYLHRHGFQFTVLSREQTAEGLGVPEGAEYHPVPITPAITPLTDLRAIWRMIRILRRGRFDLVQYTTPKGALLGSIAAFVAHVPVRLYLMWGIYYMGRRGARRFLLKTLERIPFGLSTHIVFDGFGIRRFALDEGLCAESRTSVVGDGGDNGIDVDLLRRDRWLEQGRSLRAEWDVPADGLVIGCVARIVNDKGINELVMAFDDLSRTHPRAYLVLVGRVETKDCIRPETLRLIRSHGRIRVFPFQQDILPYYAAMDVFCLPTYREGFSAVTLEAAAMELPVVTSDAVGAGETIADGQTGIVVPVRNVLALKEALSRLLDDAELRQRFGRAGRQRVVERFERGVFWENVRRHREDLLIRQGGFARDASGRLRRKERAAARGR